MDSDEDQLAELYRSQQNAGPRTRAMFEYQDMCVVLRCIPNLLPQSPVSAVAVEWSTDYILLGQEGQRELVSVKHRSPGQGDWTFSRLKNENVFRDLHAVWRAMGQKGSYFFESNAGFEPSLKMYEQRWYADDTPDPDAVRRLADCLGVDFGEASQFMKHFKLRADPLPGWAHIDDVAAQRLAAVMTRLGLSPARATVCVSSLAECIAAASTQRRPPADQRVDRLIGFMQDLAGWMPNEPAGAIVTISHLRTIMTTASSAAITASALSQHNGTYPQDVPVPGLVSMRDDHSESAYRETLRVIRNRTRTLIGRQRELAELQEFASSDNEDVYGNGYLWVCGAPWAGKTALLAEAVQALSARLDCDVAAFFLIARESQASREQFLTAVTEQLAWLLRTEPPRMADVHSFRQLWARAVERAESEDNPRQLLLIIDGLDEDLRPGGHSVAALLPTEHLGQHSRVLVSSRPHPEIPLDVDPEHPLREAGVMILNESPHAIAIRSRAEQEISGVLSATRSSMAVSELAFDILGLLTAAGGPVSIDDITLMLDANRRDVRAFLTGGFARSVELTGSPREERYGFAHQTLLDYCAAHPDIGGEDAYITKISSWASTWEARGWPNTYDASTSTPTYLLDSYPTALARSRTRSAPDLLAKLVADQRWMDTAITRVGPLPVLGAVRSAIELKRDPSLAGLLRVVEHQAQMRDRSGKSPGWTETSLMWDALGHAQEGGVSETIQTLRRHRPPYLIPEWMSGRVPGAVRALAVTNDGELVSGGGIDGALLQWNPSIPGRSANEIGRHHGVVLAVAVTQKDSIASAGLDGVIRIWPSTRPSGSARLLGRCTDGIRALVVTPEHIIVSGSHGGEIWVWDPQGPHMGGRLLGCHEGQVRGVGTTADGRIVTGGTDGLVKLWDPYGGERSVRLLGRYSPIMGLAVLSGRYVAAAGLNGRICLWDIRRPARGHIEMISDTPVRSITATQEGHVIFGCSDGSVGIWDPAVTGNRGLVLGSYRGAVGAVTAASGNRIFAATDNVITMFTMTVV